MHILDVLLIVGCVMALYHLYNGAIYVPTESKTVEQIVESLNIKTQMRVADLGSGDGRIVIALALAGAHAVGYENNPVLFIWSWIKIRRLRLLNAQIKLKSFWSVDLSQYDAVVVFGMTHIMVRLQTKLESELRPGAVIVSNIFGFPNWSVEREQGGLRVYRRGVDK